MEKFRIEKIIAVGASDKSPLAARARKAWPEAEYLRTGALNGDGGLGYSQDPVREGKRTLALYENKGRFIRKCPGTMGLVCCNYWVVDLAEGCAIDCSYCVLQGYLNDRRIKLATNLQDLEEEMDREITASKGPIRIGTGELSDSLMFDHELDVSQSLVSMFRKRPSATLELKTKTSNIETILKQEPAQNVVIAWSLNTPIVAEREEAGAAPVMERIDAAARVSRAGWKVAFHFDPLVVHEGWEEGYRKVAAMLDEAVDPEMVEWISLGALRFHPSMKSVIRQRFGMDGILKGEFVLCPDSKMRYAKPLRLALLGAVREAVSGAMPGAPIYLCMEDAGVWRRVMGQMPGAGPARRLFA